MNRRGLTLLEMVISLAILTIVISGATYGVLLSGRALQLSAASSGGMRSSADALSQVLAEMQTATGFSERTATAVTFTVPDRNQDAQAETIRYSWSGAAGAPLYRQYNSEAAVVVALNVKEFNLDYLTELIGPTETAEMVLTQQLDGSGGSTSNFTLSVSNPEATCAQYFKPALPINTIGWRITKVSVYCRRTTNKEDDWSHGGSAGLIRLVYPTAQLTPSTTVLDSVPFNAAAMNTSLAWRDYAFTNQTYLGAAEGMCIRILQTTWGGSAIIRYETGGTPKTANTHWMSSNDGGSTWTSPESTKDMIFKVYGKIKTNGAPQW